MGTACSKPSAIKTRPSDPPPHQQKPVAVATEKPPAATESAPPKKQEEVHPLQVSDKEATADTKVDEDSGNDDDGDDGEGEHLRQCSVCKKASVSPKRCGGCKMMVYCGVECQKKDWPTHKATCAKEHAREQAPMLCSVCKKASVSPKRCGGCKMMVYCGVECQKKDWPTHKAICEVSSGSTYKTVPQQPNTQVEKPAFSFAPVDDDDESENDGDDDDKYGGNSELKSAIKDINADPTNHHRWYYVGTHLEHGDTVSVSNVKYTARQCILKVLEIDPNYADAWRFLGNTLTRPLVNVNTIHYTKGQCYIKALEINPDDSETWTNLAGTIDNDKETVTVSGKVYTKQECHIKAQECGEDDSEEKSDEDDAEDEEEDDDEEDDAEDEEEDDDEEDDAEDEEEDDDDDDNDDDEYGGNSELKSAIEDINADPTNHYRWYYVGKHLLSGETASVNNVKYTARQCLMKVLEIDPNYDDAWHYICTFVDKPTLMINGKEYTHAQCCIKALEIDSDTPETWSCLADTLANTVGNVKDTVTVSGKVYTKAECYIKAVECDSYNGEAWYKLSVHGFWDIDSTSVSVDGNLYTERECVAKCLEVCDNNRDAWVRVTGLMQANETVTIDGEDFTRQQCTIKILELNDEDTLSWRDLADSMQDGDTVIVDDVQYTREKCYKRADGIDDDYDYGDEEDED